MYRIELVQNESGLWEFGIFEITEHFPIFYAKESHTTNNKEMGLGSPAIAARQAARAIELIEEKKHGSRPDQK